MGFAYSGRGLIFRQHQQCIKLGAHSKTIQNHPYHTICTIYTTSSMHPRYMSPDLICVISPHVSKPPLQLLLGHFQHVQGEGERRAVAPLRVRHVDSHRVQLDLRKHPAAAEAVAVVAAAMVAVAVAAAEAVAVVAAAMVAVAVAVAAAAAAVSPSVPFWRECGVGADVVVQYHARLSETTIITHFGHSYPSRPLLGVVDTEITSIFRHAFPQTP